MLHLGEEWTDAGNLSSGLLRRRLTEEESKEVRVAILFMHWDFPAIGIPNKDRIVHHLGVLQVQ